MNGVSLSWRELTDDIVHRYRLTSICRGDGEPEYLFLWRAQNRRLPVWVENQLLILPWHGFCRLEDLEAGHWSHRCPVRVEIPATLGQDKGVWYPIREGINGVLIHRKVFMLTQVSTHYYKIMTRNPRMPMFANGDL